MKHNIVALFLKDECDQHVRSVLLRALQARRGSDSVEDFTFNRFNVRLDFSNNEVIVDDELNPDYGECRLPIDDFESLITSVRW